VVAATGASGAPIGRHLLRATCGSASVAEVHFVASQAALRVARHELGSAAQQPAGLADEWLAGVERRARLVVHDIDDIGAPIASGSFRHDGMVIAPCSTATVAHVACGTTSNLVHRAAECCLKEGRKLLLLVRESPLSVVHLENLLAAARAGARVIPLSPPWYHRPTTLEELLEDTCARALDHLGLEAEVRRRWQGEEP
jgi:4-hydroxy-3-polyprenylbenzoate decarboxylase